MLGQDEQVLGVMQEHESNAMKALKTSISHIAENIDRYRKQPQHFTRNRKQPFEKLVKVMLNMQGNCINAELQEAFPELPERMTASAYVQARDKLSLPVFEDLLSHYNQSAPKRLLNGKYRLYAIDGSDFTTPWNPQSAFVVDTYKRNGESIKPFCQIHANIMYDIASRQYMDCVLQPRNSWDERNAALKMISRLPKDNPFIIIMDRGYESFNLIETLNRTENCHYVLRARTNGIKEINYLPDEECDMEIAIPVTTSHTEYLNKRANGEPVYKINAPRRHIKENRSPKTRTQRWDFEDKCTIKFRIVKFLINDPDTGDDAWEILVTNLNRLEFPVAQMKELYHMRWGIETSFRDMKYSLGGMHFHSKKDEAVQMEIYAHLIMFNAVARNVIAAGEWEAAQAEAAKQTAKNTESSDTKEPTTKYPYNIDFKMACLSTRSFFRLHRNEPIEKLYEELLKYKQPIRQGRQDERNIKPKSAVAFGYRVA